MLKSLNRPSFYDFGQKVGILTKLLQNFLISKISRIFIECVNLGRVNLWRRTVQGAGLVSTKSLFIFRLFKHWTSVTNN